MKLIRLRVESFAAIGNVDVEFGPGLNVLYGPNDLGKSTMALPAMLPWWRCFGAGYVPGWMRRRSRSGAGLMYAAGT